MRLRYTLNLLTILRHISCSMLLNIRALCVVPVFATLLIILTSFSVSLSLEPLQDYIIIILVGVSGRGPLAVRELNRVS